MGVDPVTGPVVLGVFAVSALVGFVAKCERENQRRRCEEENRKAREKEARRRRDRDRKEREEREEREREEREREEREREEREREREYMEWRERRNRQRSREEEMKQRRRQREQEARRDLRMWESPLIFDNDFQVQRTSLNYLQPDCREFDRLPSIFNDRCMCGSCNLRERSRNENSCDCFRCQQRDLRMWESPLIFDNDFLVHRTSLNYLQPDCREFDRLPSIFNDHERSRNENSCDCSRCQPINFNPFEQKKNSVTITIKPPQITEVRSQNAKKTVSNTSTSSNSPGTKTSSSSGNTSHRGTNSAQQRSSSGSQQPQRNNNNNNNNNNKKDTTRDYGKLNDFMKILKSVLDRCNASPELRERILAFFDNFEKHEENFLRILNDFRTQDIPIEDILSIVIRLFQSDSFARDVAFGNFIAMMEIVAKYITEELSIEIAKDVSGNTKPWAEQRADCMKKVVQRKNIVTEIKELIEKVRKEIIEDNTNRPLEPDFSGIFTKVYHYLKHRKVRGEEWTVKQYFDWIRKLLIALKLLDPEYAELQNVNHSRREIVFEMYSTVLEGRLFIVVRAGGRILRICTFYVKEKKDKKAKDGDKYVDGKKKS